MIERNMCVHAKPRNTCHECSYPSDLVSHECECCKKMAPILMKHLEDYAELLRTLTGLITNIRIFMEGNPRETGTNRTRVS
jgi:hypothetical protein